jgi:hypothetical protein
MNQERIELKIRKITHRLVLNVRHWSRGSGSHTDSVAIESDTPFATIHNGERIRIGGIEGFPESRLMTGVVRSVSHIISGGTHDFMHEVTAFVDQDREP